MAFWLQIPLETRLVLLFVLGAVVGGQVNRGIYRLAWNPRPIGPWSAPPEKAPPRRWFDRLPIIGWWGLRREAKIHGRGFWIRPLLIELALAFLYAWLYWWEMNLRLLPPFPPPVPVADLHAQYLSHIVLISLMTVATFIDFDEKTIPDEITVPGLLLGLALAAGLPHSHLPIAVWAPLAAAPIAGNLKLTSPYPWPPWLSDEPRWLAVGLALYLAWCLAVTPARWRPMRRRYFRAILLWWVSVFRHRTIWYMAALSCLGAALIAPTWFADGERWEALFSSLVGMAFAGALVWIVRIVAGGALRQEAMGFGDVTLMAMIGAFVGWQPSLFIFFLAPILCILIALAQWILTGRPDIAFGPYLCAATFCTIVFWDRIWTGWLGPIFSLGWFIPIVLVICMALMAPMLLAVRALTAVFDREEA